MSESAADLTLSASTPSKWQAAIEAGLESGRPISISELSQRAPLKELTTPIAFVESPLGALLDLEGTNTAWAAAFPLLKRQSTLVIDAAIAQRFSCPESYSGFLVELVTADIPIERVVSADVPFDLGASLLSLADDGQPIDSALSSVINGLRLPGPIRAGLLLANGDDDASHRVSQSSEGHGDFDYWHGLMHRREPDFGNASYWFRRVGDHPAYADLPSELARVTEAVGLDLTSDNVPWDAFGAIDVFRRALDGRYDDVTAKLVQHAEYRNLLTWNLRTA